MTRILRGMRRLLNECLSISKNAALLKGHIDEAKMLAAKGLIHQLRDRGRLKHIRDAEFKVFSQFGDDGIIQYLLQHVPLQSRRFIEFGVESYQEANTRFLLLNDNWQGLIMDGSAAHMEAIRHEPLYWRHDLTAAAAFVTKDNINPLFTQHGFTGDVDLLSVDIDGNDYWVWEAIEVVQARIVIVEYNAVFGAKRAVTVPYDPQFVRSQAHYSHLYWGVSLKALCLLAERKGYSFVGCNSAGNNAYFIRKDCLNDLQSLTAEEGYVASRFRESRDRQGRLTFAGGDQRIRLMAEMPIWDVEQQKMIQMAELID